MSNRTVLELSVEEQQQMAKDAGFDDVVSWQKAIIDEHIIVRRVLDLPFEVQREIAKNEGYNNIEVWAFAKKEEWRKEREEAEANRTSIFDLPLEQQQQIAKEDGYDNFDEWVEEIKEIFRSIEDEDKRPWKGQSLAEAKRKIHDLKTNPEAIKFYRRITKDRESTVEEAIFANQCSIRF